MIDTCLRPICKHVAHAQPYQQKVLFTKLNNWDKDSIFRMGKVYTGRGEREQETGNGEWRMVRGEEWSFLFKRHCEP